MIKAILHFYCLNIWQTLCALSSQQYANWYFDNYNAQKYQVLYNSFGQEGKISQTPYQFLSQMKQLWKNEGKIITNISYPTTPDGNNPYLIVFKKRLLLGAFNVQYQNKRVSMVTIRLINSSSMVDILRIYNDKISFSLNVDDFTYLQFKASLQRPIGSLQLLPLFIEYSKQVQQQNISISSSIQLEEIVKYYINGSNDTLLSYIQKKITQIKLNELIRHLMVSYSDAIVEFLAQYLGLGNILSTAKQLGLGQNQYFYPTSIKILLSNQSNINWGPFTSTYKQTTLNSLIQRVNEVHDILQTGNESAVYLLRNASIRWNSTKVQVLFEQFVTTGNVSIYAIALQKFINGSLPQMFSYKNMVNGFPQDMSTIPQEPFSYSYLSSIYRALWINQCCDNYLGPKYYASNYGYVRFLRGNEVKHITFVYLISGVNQTQLKHINQVISIFNGLFCMKSSFRKAVLESVKRFK